MTDLTDAERDALACVATGHEPDLCDCNDSYRDHDDRFCEYAQETAAVVARIVAAREAALRERVKTLTYASDDGTEYEHNDHDPHGGEPECPACWAASIRAALATGGDQ